MSQQPTGQVSDGQQTTLHEWFLASFFLLLGLFLFLPERGMDDMNRFFGLGPNGLKYYAVVVLFTLPTLIVWRRRGWSDGLQLLVKMLLLAVMTMSLAIGLSYSFNSIFPAASPFIGLGLAAIPATLLVYFFAGWMKENIDGRRPAK